MSVTVEKLEKSMAKLTIEVSAEDFDKAINKVYLKQKNRISIPGFRKGKAPRKLIEKMYGTGVFLEDAINDTINSTYPEQAQNCEISSEISSNPEIELVQAEAGKPLIYTATVAVKPPVSLGKYKGVEVAKADVAVTDEEVDAELAKEQEKNATFKEITDRAVENGDKVNLNFEGFVDGEAFEGGKGENYPLVLGTGNFIEGFEEQIVGHSAGDAFDVEVTFPEDYHAKELAGKAAVFKTVLHEIQTREVPELTDAYADDKGFDSVDAFREDVKQKLTDAKAKSAAAANENAVIGKVVENAQIELPEPMIETPVEQMIDDYARRMQSQGLQLDQYMEYTGMTMDKLKEQFHPQAVRNLKTRLTLEKVVEAENIEVSEEAIEAEIKRMAEQYKVDFEKMKEFMTEDDKKNISMDLKIQEAVDFLVAEAKLV